MWIHKHGDKEKVPPLFTYISHRNSEPRIHNHWWPLKTDKHTTSTLHTHTKTRNTPQTDERTIDHNENNDLKYLPNTHITHVRKHYTPWAGLASYGKINSNSNSNYSMLLTIV
jgi:hypothetical protein